MQGFLDFGSSALSTAIAHATRSTIDMPITLRRRDQHNNGLHFLNVATTHSTCRMDGIRRVEYCALVGALQSTESTTIHGFTMFARTGPEFRLIVERACVCPCEISRTRLYYRRVCITRIRIAIEGSGSRSNHEGLTTHLCRANATLRA